MSGANVCPTCGCYCNHPHDGSDDCIKALAGRVDSLSGALTRQSEKLRYVIACLGLNPDEGEP